MNPLLKNNVFKLSLVLGLIGSLFIYAISVLIETKGGDEKLVRHYPEFMAQCEKDCERLQSHNQFDSLILITDRAKELERAYESQLAKNGLDPNFPMRLAANRLIAFTYLCETKRARAELDSIYKTRSFPLDSNSQGVYSLALAVYYQSISGANENEKESLAMGLFETIKGLKSQKLNSYYKKRLEEEKTKILDRLAREK